MTIGGRSPGSRRRHRPGRAERLEETLQCCGVGSAPFGERQRTHSAVDYPLQRRRSSHQYGRQHTSVRFFEGRQSREALIHERRSIGAKRR